MQFGHALHTDIFYMYSFLMHVMGSCLLKIVLFSSQRCIFNFWKKNA